jgi:hypothetical protein
MENPMQFITQKVVLGSKIIGIVSMEIFGKIISLK